MRIAHYMHDVWAPGGVATYLSVVTGRLAELGHDNVFLDTAAEHAPGVIHVRDGEEVTSAARRMGADMVHLHLLPPGGYTGGLPAVRTVHGHQAYCPSGSQFLARSRRPCEHTTSTVACTWSHFVDHCGSRRPRQVWADFRRTTWEWRGSTPLIAISQFVRNRLIDAGYPPDRVAVLPNPVPPGIGPSPIPVDGRPRFLYLGRLVPQKGVDWLLDAAAAATAPLRIDVAGTGPDEARLRAMAERSDLAGCVEFHGWVSRADHLALLRSARAVVVPSLWQEPAGLTAIEAGAAGRAVIASDVGGLPEIVRPGSTGLLVPPGDTSALAAALDRLANRPDEARTLGDAGRDHVAGAHALDAHVDLLLGHYAAATRSRGQ